MDGHANECKKVKLMLCPSEAYSLHHLKLTGVK